MDLIFSVRVHIQEGRPASGEPPSLHGGSHQTCLIQLKSSEPGPGLQRPLRHPPEQLPSLRGRHGVAALQQVYDDEGPLDAGGLDPQTTVHPHHQLTGEQLLQVGPDLTVGGQQPGGDTASTVRTEPLTSPPSDPQEAFLPSDESQRNAEEQTASSKYSHPVGSSRTINTHQLRLHVLIGYEELGEHQVAHLHR